MTDAVGSIDNQNRQAQMQQPTDIQSNGTYRFEVALSFPGEYRKVVRKVARHLADHFDTHRVLYDKYHEEELARLGLNNYLPNLYLESKLIVVFLCPEYAAKKWCRMEWRRICQLVEAGDASEKRIMLLSFGSPGDLTDLGILADDGYLDISPMTPDVIARKIVKRAELNDQGTTGVTGAATSVEAAPHAEAAATKSRRLRIVILICLVFSMALGGTYLYWNLVTQEAREIGNPTSIVVPSRSLPTDDIPRDCRDLRDIPDLPKTLDGVRFLPACDEKIKALDKYTLVVESVPLNVKFGRFYYHFDSAWQQEAQQGKNPQDINKAIAVTSGSLSLDIGNQIVEDKDTDLVFWYVEFKDKQGRMIARSPHMIFTVVR